MNSTILMYGGLALVIVGGALAWWLDRKQERESMRILTKKMNTAEMVQLSEDLKRIKQESIRGTEAYEQAIKEYRKRWHSDPPPSVDDDKPRGGRKPGADS